MRGFGIIGDLISLGLIGLSILGWIYLWYVCVFGAEKVLARLFGDHALMIAALGFPFFAFGLVGAGLKFFGRNHIELALCVFGVCLPILGILYLRHETGRKK